MEFDKIRTTRTTENYTIAVTQCYIYAMFDSKRLMTSAVATTSKITRLLALLWNILDPFLDQNCSLYNLKPSYSLLTLRASWLV